MSKTIKTSNQPLLDNNPTHTSLSSTASSGGNTLSVYSIAGFAVNKAILIGEFGQEGSEIISTHSATAPSGTTITLASNLTKSHPKDTKIYVIPYNKLYIYHSDTISGAKTEITNVNVDSESLETVYTDSAYSSGYYFVRFFNSASNTYSSYSDPIPYDGFGTNTVSYIIRQALKETEKELSSVLTFEVLINQINACLRHIRGKLKRWSNVQEFNYVLDQMNRGEYFWSLPSTYYDKNSNKSMLQVKVGSRSLIYKDKKEFDNYFEDTVHSQVATQAEIGATSLVLDSTGDLPSSGTIHYYISNTLYSVDFSSNDKDTNTLTTDALTVQTPVDTNIWYGESEGEPNYFSVWDGNLYIWPLIDSTNAGKNIYLDFYTDIVNVNSDSDEITLARYDMVLYWLKWQIRNITERNGNPDLNDGDWVLFASTLNDAIRRESSGQKYKTRPFINGITYRGNQNEYLPFDKS